MKINVRPRYLLPVISVLFSLICGPQNLLAQHFDGTNGSLCNPAINNTTQPASGAAMPYSWSLEVLGVNGFWSNNILSLSPAKWDWRQDPDTVDITPYLVRGSKKRWGELHSDLNLLNFLYRLPGHDDWAVGGGLNIRSHTSAGNMDYDYEEEMDLIEKFLQANTIGRSQTGKVVNQEWLEFFLNASKMLKKSQDETWYAGASLKILKGHTAGVADLSQLSATLPDPDFPQFYPLAIVEGRYAYSENLNEQVNDPTRFHNRSLKPGGSLSLGLDIGFTIVKNNPVYVPGFSQTDPTDYNWKLDLSLTDLGRLKYKSGDQSRILSGLNRTAYIAEIQNAITAAESLGQLNDSLSRFIQMKPWDGKFSVSLPTRLHIGFDKNLGRNFYLNTHLSFDASFLNFGTDYKGRNLSYLAVAPRWEKQNLGVFVPFYINEKGTALIGTAIKLGPLVAGVHDFRWLFTHTKSGGGYLSVTVNHLSKKDKGNTACPVF